MPRLLVLALRSSRLCGSRGLLLGVAVMVATELVPKAVRGIRPFVRSAIKNGYAATRKTREWMAEAGEQSVTW